MTARHTYWTIILADGPTSFRARDRALLVPTLRQLQSRDPAAALKWFANGRLWDSPEQAVEQTRLARLAWRKTRGPDWRPGGDHRDPRDRVTKAKPRRQRPGPSAAGPGNQGTAAAAPAPVGVYYSSNWYIDQEDPLLRSAMLPPLAAGQSTTVTLEGVLPINEYIFNFHLGWKCNSSFNFTELWMISIYYAIFHSTKTRLSRF